MGGVDYIARVEPTGLMESPLPVFSFIALTFTMIRSWIRRDSTWTITVRKRADDPFGDVIHREVLPSRQLASTRADELVREARSGDAVWLRR